MSRQDMEAAFEGWRQVLGQEASRGRRVVPGNLAGSILVTGETALRCVMAQDAELAELRVAYADATGTVARLNDHIDYLVRELADATLRVEELGS